MLISGGGARLLSSFYINSGGSRKTTSSAFANISGSRKQIYPYSATTTTTYYYWERYYVNSNGSVTKTPIGHVVEVGGTEGEFYILVGYGSSCIGKDSTGLYMTWEKSTHLYYVSDACGWGKYFGIVRSVPSTNRIYAKDTFNGNLYTCDHNMYWTYNSNNVKSVMCRYDENCVYTLSYTVSSYSQGSYIDRVSSTSRYAYPDNSYSGSYWYVYSGSEVVYS